MQETSQLLAEIKHHNRKYRQGIPEISDKEYDALVAQLAEADPDNEWFKSIEPGFVGERRKAKLPVPMKSLKKAKSLKELQSWVKSLRLNKETSESLLVITPKFDGLSLLYDETCEKAYSRGGEENEGQDCSAHIRFANIETAKDPKLHFTYGEFVFSRQAWEQTFAGKTSPETGELYKSPRNTAAGLLNRDEPTKGLRFVDFYRYGTDEVSLQQFSTYTSLFNYLCRTYNQEPLYYVICMEDITEELLFDLFSKWRKKYYIDGLVVYVNDIKSWSRLGRQENTGNPNYAIAYKDPGFTDIFDTTVKNVTWKVSKAGMLKPVVNIEKINVGDCDIENPTGYNAKWIIDHKIGPGAKIKITRSGGVIPKIVEIVEGAKEPSYPVTCPDCGSPLAWNESNVELCCRNANCPGTSLAKIVHFYTTLEAEQVGEELLRKIYSNGYNTLKKMLDITFEELLEMEGIGEGIANMFLNVNFLIRQGVEVTKLMHASDCFAGIGQVKAAQLLSKMGKEDRFAFTYGLVKIEEGYDTTQEFKALSKTWQSFFKGIIPFYKFIADNGLNVLPMEDKPAATSDKYKGMRVCFTGIRDKLLENSIVAGGGEIASGVNKKTTHLIVADKESTSHKTARAMELGIPILSIDEFRLL